MESHYRTFLLRLDTRSICIESSILYQIRAVEEREINIYRRTEL